MRGIWYRVVVKEVNVFFFVIIYYFKDIFDLIVDMFILFVENVMNDVLDLIYKNVGEFIGEYKVYVGSSIEINNWVVEVLVMMIVVFFKYELIEKCDYMIVE